MIPIALNEIVDISPRVGGILDLRSNSIDGIYEVRRYICRSNQYSIISRGNYTDMTIIGGANNCISIANVSPYPINVSYSWTLGGGINALLISVSILYTISLILIGIITCCICACGGRVFRYLYDRRISPILNRSNGTCTIVKPLPSVPTCDTIYTI